MAIAPLIPFPASFTDNNGVPLSGGKLFTYAAGTTSPVATYTDSTGTTQNTNPVILNARGEAPIFIDDTLSYKFTLSPSTDTNPPTNSIWTVDNVSFAINANRTAIAALAAGSITMTKDTQADLYADLAHAAGTIALVYADPTATNNDLYVKSGASGSGSWSATGIFTAAASSYAAAAASSASQASVNAAAAATNAATANTAAINAGNAQTAAASAATQALAAEQAIESALGAGGSDVTLRANLAVGSGSGLIGWLASWTGAAFRSLSAKLGDWVSVKDFGAKGDTVLSGTPNGSGSATIVSGTDDTAAIQAAINYLNSIGGGGLYFPQGLYKISAPLTACKNLRMFGAGKRGAYIVCAFDGTGIPDGSAIASVWPSNTSTNANIRVHDLGVHCPSTTNKGAAFYDNGGHQVFVDHCFLSGFANAVVFDQTEIGHVSACDLWIQNGATTTSAGVWIVNGAQITPGNQSGFTNIISVKCCQINQGANSFGILDEGGDAHAFCDNNYNGSRNSMYIAGAQSAHVRGGYCEAAVGPNFIISNLRYSDGGGVGAPTVKLDNVWINASGTNACINGAGTGNLHVSYCRLLSSSSVVPITGAANLNITLDNNTVQSSTGEAVDSYTSALKDGSVELPVQNVTNSFTLASAQASKLLRNTNTNAQTVTIPPDSTTAFRIGTRALYEQATSTGTASFAAGVGVTINGPTSTTAQYQVLAARKVAANTWETWLLVPSPYAPRVQSITSAATITPSADNNDQVHVTALAAAATIANPTSASSPFPGQRLTIRIKDNGTGRALTWGNGYRAMATALPTTTVAGKVHYLVFRWNGTDSLWDALIVVQQA